MTLSRRRLAFCAVAAAVALTGGVLAGKLAGPGRSHQTSVARSAGPTASSSPTPSSVAPAPASPSAAPAAGAAPAASAALPTSAPTVSLSDPRSGFTLSYPRAWSRLGTKDPSVPLLLSSGDGVSLLVRGVQLSQTITGPRLAVIRDYTGRLIRSQPGVKIIAGPRLVASANLPGFVYLSSFVNPVTHQQGAHSQIVLFAGRRMFTLVFQTDRLIDLTRFAMLFDKITASFRAT